MSSDGGLRQLLRSHLPGWHWTWIEGGAGSPGAPDAAWTRGGHGMVELKQTHAWAVHFRPPQIAWHRADAEAGGRTKILVRRWQTTRRDDELWMLRSSDVPMLAERGLRHPHLSPVLVTNGGPRHWDWGLVDVMLRG